MRQDREVKGGMLGIATTGGVGAETLAQRIPELIGDARLVIVSNREPWIHELSADGIRTLKPASGMVTAIEPIVKATGGLWIAHGSGSADRKVVDTDSKIRLPEDSPQYTLKRVWINKKDEEGSYYGLSNRALWPLSHITYTRPHFSESDWDAYMRTNRLFADTLLDEISGDKAIVFVQDYHLALLPRMVKEARPDVQVVQFWHIPWPNREAFRIFPWGKELLNGLLGNDLLGFHIQYHCNNFLDTIDRGIEAMVDYERFRVYRGGRPTYVAPFPISVDYAQLASDAAGAAVERQKERFYKEIEANGEIKLYVGADRIDYTKGIPERLAGFDLMLQEHPELKEKVMFVQLAAPSRIHVEEYRDLNEKLDDLVDQINWRHQTDTWAPIRFLRAHHDYYSVLAAYRMADVLVVTSLHDGMNLVAKEYVAACGDKNGSLILSKYTGAARELEDAILVNPFNVSEIARAMFAAYAMDETERTKMMTRMKAHVSRRNVYEWGLRIFERLKDIMEARDQ